MQTLTSKVVLDGIRYAEGPRWHAGRLWFSDMLASTVWTYDPATDVREVAAKTPDKPSGLGFLPDGRLLVATAGTRQLLRRDPGGLAIVADLSGVCDSLNDMVVDAQGRAYVDAYFMGGAPRGAVILVRPDGVFRTVAPDLMTPNGLAITPDGRTLVVNDLSACKLLAFDIAGDGSLSGQRVFADLDGRSPDGLCLDAEGGAWVGLPFQGRFQRIREGGEVTHEIAYPDRWGVAPALGGPDRRTLYLCTAQVKVEDLIAALHDPAPAPDVSRAWIEAVEVDVPGAGWP
jgi:sugar lactone lactonase YvrE